MVTTKQIRDIGRNIGREFHPQQVLLFGSYAHGTATEDSDVDLLVIMPFADKAVRKAVEIRLKINPSFPIDLLVRTPETVRHRIAMGDDFMRDILEHGKVLYESDHC